MDQNGLPSLGRPFLSVAPRIQEISEIFETHSELTRESVITGKRSAFNGMSLRREVLPESTLRSALNEFPQEDHQSTASTITLGSSSPLNNLVTELIEQCFHRLAQYRTIT